MPVYAEITDAGLKAIDLRTNVAVEKVVSETAEDFLQMLREEIPWDSIREDIAIEYKTHSRDFTVAEIVIGAQTGANQYIWELWKGSAEERIHEAHGKAMRFSNWINGPEELRHVDGFFYFKRVTHPRIEGNDFVGRALARLRMQVKTQFGPKFANYFKNIRR